MRRFVASGTTRISTTVKNMEESTAKNTILLPDQSRLSSELQAGHRTDHCAAAVLPWVANVPSMIDFSRPKFDTSDPSKKNRANREEYFKFLRVPVPPEYYRFIQDVENGPNQLFHPDGLPLMPLNSGDNSVTNDLIYKFLTLTLTQYFFYASVGPWQVHDRRRIAG